MTIYDSWTALSPREVIDRAEIFFTRANSPEAAFVQARGERFIRFHQDTGEMMIAAMPQRNGTRVRASASRNSRLLARFVATLAAPTEVVETVSRHGEQRTMAAVVERVALPTSDPAEAA